MFLSRTFVFIFSYINKNFFLGKSDLRSKLELFWVRKNRDKMSRSGWYFMECTLDSKRKPLFKLTNLLITTQGDTVYYENEV